MVLLHANAVNIARRLSIKNEHDLLQETFYGKNPKFYVSITDTVSSHNVSTFSLLTSRYSER